MPIFAGRLLATALCFAVVQQASAEDCAEIAKLAVSGGTITSATAVPAGPMMIPRDPMSGAHTVSLPAFCRIQGIAGGSVGFDVWLPTHGWNGRLLSVGSSGFGGAVQSQALSDGLGKAYAVTSNDTGHQGQDRSWMHDPAKVTLWGHTASHIVTAPAKAIVRAFYGRPADHAYFTGCSTGGAQAMAEAEYFPSDYDGIVAGAPGMSYAHLMLSFLWGLKATQPPGAVLPQAKLALLHQKVLDACDTLDGVKDGLISNPQACHFDVRTLTCKAGDAPDCLTAAQVMTARLIYQGPRNPRTGAAIYPGFDFGSEADTSAGAGDPLFYGWSAIQGPLAQIFAIPLLRDMVYHDPNWDWRRFDWDRDVADLDRRVGADITAINPDLRAFARRAGKLIVYQGWGDPLNAATLPVLYRQQAIGVFSRGDTPTHATARVDDFLRLFMVPGMAHCGGGPGPGQFDALGALRQWVEDGHAPDRLIGKNTNITRPICAYPASARWSGNASPSEANSFRCLQ